jgi:hypothetical protein
MCIPALYVRARPCYLNCPHAVFPLFHTILPKQFGNIIRRNEGHVQPYRWRCISQLASRSAKARVSIRTEDLPQGTITLDPVPLEVDAPTYPTVILQARANMRKYDNCVLLTRVGGFYELYFEQAEQFGPLLNLKVAQKRTNAGPVPMVRSSNCLVWLSSMLKECRPVFLSSNWTDS